MSNYYINKNGKKVYGAAYVAHQIKQHGGIRGYNKDLISYNNVGLILSAALYVGIGIIADKIFKSPC